MRRNAILAAFLAAAIGAAGLFFPSPLLAQDGTIKVRINDAHAFKHDNDDVFDPGQDFYAINSIDFGPPFFTPQIGGHDDAAWSDQINVKLVPGRNQRFFDLYFELWDKDDCCFGNVDDGFDISPQPGPPGPVAPGGIFVPGLPTGSNPHVTYDVCTGRMSVNGVLGTNPIPLGSNSATLDGRPSSPGVADTWASLRFDVIREPANWLPDDVAVANVEIVQSVYGATNAVVDKPTSLIVTLASTHPFPINAPVHGTLTDGITTVLDLRSVIINPGSVANPGITLVSLFDGSSAPPFRPQKSLGVGTNKVSGSATVDYAENTSPNAPIQLMDCGNINNTGAATDLPLRFTFDKVTLFEPFDYEEDKNFMTSQQLQAMYDREEPYRLSSWPLASLNSTKSFNQTWFDHGSDCVLCFEPFNTLIHYNIAAAMGGIERWVLSVRKGWFADNQFRHQFIGAGSVGYSLGWFAPRAVLAEDGFYGVSTHELGHTYNLSQHPCSNQSPPWGPGCFDEYAHPAFDGRPYEALGFDVSGLIYPNGIHVGPFAPYGNLNCPVTAPQSRDICAPNLMDLVCGIGKDCGGGYSGYQNWVDTFTYQYLMDVTLPSADPPVVNLSGAIHLPTGQGSGTPPPLIEGTFLPFAWQFMGTQDLPDAPLTSVGQQFSGVGPLRIRLVTTGGVRDYRFMTRFFDDPSRPDLLGGFSINIPWDPGTQRIQLIGPSNPFDTGCWNKYCEGDGVILDQKIVTRSGPSASDLRAGRDTSAPPTPAGGLPATPTIGPGHNAVVDWTAFDFDSPALSASLLVIPPGSAAGGGSSGGGAAGGGTAGGGTAGGTQIPIAIDIAGGTFTIPQQRLADTPGLYTGRVLVSDGVNTTEVWNGALFNICNLSNGGVELCNGIDDDCDGIVDNAPLPGPESVQLNPQPFPPAPGGTTIMLQWPADALAQSYDVVFGDLDALRSSGGNFTGAIMGCLADNLAATSLGPLPDPPPGHGYFFELRGNDCTGAGTYDSGDPAQVGLRDAEINASPLACRP